MVASQPEVQLILGMLVLAGAYSLLRSVPDLLQFLQTVRVRAVDPGDATPGLTKVRGTPSPLDGPAEAPYTNVDCLAYEARTDRYQFDRNGSNWETGYTKATGVPFELRDPTAAVEVDPAAAEFFFADSYKAQGNREDGPPAVDDPEREFSSAVFHQLEDDGELRYHEHRLDVGEDATVVGVAEYESGPGSALTIESENSRTGLIGRFLDPPMIVAGEGGPSVPWKLLRPALPPLFGAITFWGIAVGFYLYLSYV